MGTKINSNQRFSLITLLAICSFFWAGSLLAAGCTITCNGVPCTATGENARCWCHWFTGNPCCEGSGGGIEQELGVDADEDFSKTRLGLTFVEMGGDLGALLDSDLDEFYGAVIKSLGFDDRTHILIRELHNLKRYRDAGDGKGYRSAEEMLEKHIWDFSDKERYAIAEHALDVIRKSDVR